MMLDRVGISYCRMIDMVIMTLLNLLNLLATH